MAFTILTDSSADLSQEMVKELDLTILPLTVHMDGKDYRDLPDESELSAKTFYANLRAGSLATTSQVNTEAFTAAVRPLLEAGQDVLYIGFSSGLSGTFNSGRLALEELSEQFPERSTRAVDTLAASMGQGLLVYYAAKMRDAGKSLAETADWLEENRLHLAHWFTVDDLNFLKRGGRVSGAVALFGTMLSIKPVMHVDDGGFLVPVGKVRGRRASIDALLEHMKQTAIKPESQTVFISHGDCYEDAKYLADQIRKTFGTKDIRIHTVGPVIGAHSGPGTMALFFLANTRD